MARLAGFEPATYGLELGREPLGFEINNKSFNNFHPRFHLKRGKESIVNQKDRYQYFPQMEVYDKLRVDWVPYLMFFNKPNFRSNVVNTDSRGFRFSGMMG